MLRIEMYPVMSGLMVRAVACHASGDVKQAGANAMGVTRVIPVETVEALGLAEAVRDHITDLAVLYPALFEQAMD